MSIELEAGIRYYYIIGYNEKSDFIRFLNFDEKVKCYSWSVTLKLVFTRESDAYNTLERIKSMSAFRLLVDKIYVSSIVIPYKDDSLNKSSIKFNRWIIISTNDSNEEIEYLSSNQGKLEWSKGIKNSLKFYYPSEIKNFRYNNKIPMTNSGHKVYEAELEIRVKIGDEIDKSDFIKSSLLEYGFELSRLGIYTYKTDKKKSIELVKDSSSKNPEDFIYIINDDGFPIKYGSIKITNEESIKDIILNYKFK